MMSTTMTNNVIKNRYEFILLFDVTDGNPNGDPDAGNMPRIDAETGMGLVTDVCIKRKVRNYIQIIKQYKRPYDIYIKEKAVLGRAHVEAFKKLDIKLGEETKIKIPDELNEEFTSISLPDGLLITEEDDSLYLVTEVTMDKKQAKEEFKLMEIDNKLKKIIKSAIDNAKPRKPSAEETEKGRVWMCHNYYDIRTFGAVLSLKSAPNCGQVRGPVQLTFARSIDPIISLEHSITRMAVATEAKAEKQKGDNRTMGRKHTVPYALYRTHGFISPHFAANTGFSEEDLALFWESLKNMFDHDHSAARGQMYTRKLIVFKHESALGNAPAHVLFDLVNVNKTEKNGKPIRSFSDYTITIHKDKIPQNVELLEMV